jgi:hypothetical protein
MRSDSYPTSCHEAGHALTAYLCGGEAWIERKGLCGASIPDDAESEDRWVVAHMLVDASGLAAESLLCPFDPDAQLAAGGDREGFASGCKFLRSIGSLFVAASDEVTWEWYLGAAKSLLARHAHVLTDVADQVERRSSLDRGTLGRRIDWWGIRPLFTDGAWKSALVDLLEDSVEALQASADAQAVARRLGHRRAYAREE